MDSTARRLYRWYALPGTAPIPQQEGGLLSLRASNRVDGCAFRHAASIGMDTWRGLQADLARPVRTRRSGSKVIHERYVSERDVSYQVMPVRHTASPRVLGRFW